MRRVALAVFKLVLAYIGAGAILLMYIMRSNFVGHADIPFSGFPEFLVWSPIAPVLIASEISKHQGNGLPYEKASLLLAAKEQPRNDCKGRAEN